MTKIINMFFWAFWSLSICFGYLEAFTYSGFIFNHLYFNLSLIVYIFIFLGTFQLVFRFISGGYKIERYEKHILIIFVINIFMFAVLKIVNRLTFPNFIFSKIHVQPDNLFLPVLITFIPLVVIWAPRINIKHMLTAKKIIYTLCVGLIIFNLYKIYKIENLAVKFMINHPKATYSQKMGEKIGSTFYNFTQFIIKYTPENASLLMPPQAFPWPQSGNGAFLRYFVYPRSVGNGMEFGLGDGVNINDYDYVLLSWGETDTTEQPYTHGWPKFNVPAEKIILMNLDGSFNSEITGDYKYNNFLDKKVWGLIKVKRK